MDLWGARIDGKTVEISDMDIRLDKQKKHNIDIVVDRLIIKEGIDKGWLIHWKQL